MAMPTNLDELKPRLKTISFDCYGTLIDWISGIRAVFEELCSGGAALAGDERAFFDTYLEVESEVEAGPYVGYREVLTRVQQALAKRLGIDFARERASLLADSLARWRPFPDTNEALRRLKSRYRLCILSNIDRDLFARTARHLAVEFDFVITAEDVGAYKPARPHFDRLLAEAAESTGSHLHVAQSLFHDGVPAAEMGVPFVWINRREERNGTAARPLAEFPRLGDLADALGV